MSQLVVRTKLNMDDYNDFINFLCEKHPLHNLKHYIDIIQTKNKRSIKADCCKYNDTCIVTIRLGIQYLHFDLLNTIAHEYCHAIQHDQNKETYGSPNCEIQADLFAIKELYAYLNMPLVGDDSTFNNLGFYSYTKDYIKQQGGLLNAINNPPQLKEVYTP